MTYHPARRPAPLAPVLTALALLLLAMPAAATTYVMVSDQYLVESSAAAVQARVLSRDFAPGTGMPSTDYMIEVEDVLSGEVTGRNLIVRVPGGVGPDGEGLLLFGMPEMLTGERVVLFLNPNDDGTWRVAHLMMGAFHEVIHGGERLLVRDLTSATELALPGAEPGERAIYHRARRSDAFTRWVGEVARGEAPDPDYFTESTGISGSAGPAQVTGKARFFEAFNFRIRWFEFQDGQSVGWRMQAGGQPGFSQRDTERALRAGMAAWNNDNGSNVDYRYLGTTNNTTGFDGCNDPQGICKDGLNGVIFADADGSIDDPFSCGQGGTLAIGGPWLGCPAGQSSCSNIRTGPGGDRYNVIPEAEIITNAGIECFLTRPSLNPRLALEQLLAHELGHTLGINHPCTTDEVDAGQCPPLQSDALMYPFLHTDGRAAILNGDDRFAVRSLYPGSNNQGPVPAAPSDLEGVVLSATSVELTWSDNSGDETSFVVQVRAPGEDFATVASLPADTTQTVVEDLEPQTLYGFRVRARNGGGGSDFSNEIELETLEARPAAPTDLVASVLSPTSVGLTWTDASDNETDFAVEARSPATGAWITVREGVVASALDAPVTTVIDGLTSGTPYSFRARARNAEGDSEPSDVAAATPPATAPGSCVADEGAICLLDDRFRVSVQWRNQYGNGETGIGHGAVFPGSDRSGTFWFFSQDNVELIVKVLDGTTINDYYWTFYGALSDVEYWVTVFDTTDGASRTYYNAPFERCGQFDTTSIPGSDVPIEGGVGAASAAPASHRSAPAQQVTAAATGTCVADADTLCLLDGRFSVSVDWTNQFNGESGQGTAVPDQSEKTGYFWFFNESNIELVVKTLDATSLDGNFWFFYGALSNVGYTITVTDTVTDTVKTYVNEPGEQCGQFDTSAFTP